MLQKRIIPCLDIQDWRVVKWVKFREHKIIWDISKLAKKYADSWADELVLYDISASTTWNVIDKQWISDVAEVIRIPFCVAGWIKNMANARQILSLWADKISINSPALDNPDLINELVSIGWSQAVVIWVDSYFNGEDYYVYKYTWSEKTIQNTWLKTVDWIKEVVRRWAWEVVLNCINNDWVTQWFDIKQLQEICRICDVPLIASWWAGLMKDFLEVFIDTNVSWALAASVFHYNKIKIQDLKQYLHTNNILWEEHSKREWQKRQMYS